MSVSTFSQVAQITWVAGTASAVCAHVRTHRVATPLTLRERAHTPCRNATHPARTCAHTASQRYSPCAHVRAHRVATLLPLCARARTPCRNATHPVRTCAHTASQRHSPCAHCTHTVSQRYTLG